MTTVVDQHPMWHDLFILVLHWFPHYLNFVYALQISSYFTEKLLGIVRDTILHMKELSKSENEKFTSPVMTQVSSKASKGDAALEFIKHVCAVLSLDQNVQHDVLVFYLISPTISAPIAQVQC